MLHKKLQEIRKQKLSEIAAIPLSISAKREIPIISFKEIIEKRNGVGLIAEIKKASPSKGIIRPNFNLDEIIDHYNAIPADAVSVLTDEKFFQGSSEYLKRFKTKSIIPVLRKDFIIDERQVIQSYNMGADIILLIVAMLSKEQLFSLHKLAIKLGMEVLVEAHTIKEVELGMAAGAQILGINNRDLNTFKVNINNCLELAAHIPDNILKVAESGLSTSEDIKKIEQAGFKAALIGEAFMVSSNIQETYNQLFSK